MERTPRPAPGSITPVCCDVSDPASVDALNERCDDLFGHVHVLCNNAGITGPVGRTHEYELDDWDRVMGVNVRCSFLVLRGALRRMLANGGGAVVNTASIRAFVFSPGSAVYPPSKGAVVMMTRQATVEFVKDGIRVNAVCPGLVHTPILDGATVPPEELGQFVPMGPPRYSRGDRLAGTLPGQRRSFVHHRSGVRRRRGMTSI
jgi:meso-butanediol dehydrogenase/(S,S)-butanediol dehydrogenase/diacetyl reductase